MADAVSNSIPTVKVSGAAPKKRGRKPKVRHDIADDVPIDGDYQPLDLENEDPAFEYAWMTDKDLGSVGRKRGYVIEKWGPGCARPRAYFGAETAGSDVKQNELTLAKIPKARIQKFRDGEAKRHRGIMSGLLNRGPKDFAAGGRVRTGAAETKIFQS